MAGAAAIKAIICAALLAALVMASVGDGAITCTTVIAYVGSCVPYVTSRGPLDGCCDGVRGLYGVAGGSTADLRTVCHCLKSRVRTYSGIDFDKLAGIPRICRISLPYAISPDTDCARVT